MTTQIFGAPITRQEDQRFLTGTGTYIDDIDLPDMLHAAILRSPHAHARIHSIDTSQASRLDGVQAVLTYNDLGPIVGPLPLLIPHPALTHPHTQCALAKDVVRYGSSPLTATSLRTHSPSSTSITTHYPSSAPATSQKPQHPTLHSYMTTHPITLPRISCSRSVM